LGIGCQLYLYNIIFGRIKREKASEIAFRSQKWMAGAEGLEPSARGFPELVLILFYL